MSQEPANLTEQQRKDLAEALGILLGAVAIRVYLRRRGLTPVQAYVVGSSLTSLGTISLRLKKLLDVQREALELRKAG